MSLYFLLKQYFTENIIESKRQNWRRETSLWDCNAVSLIFCWLLYFYIIVTLYRNRFKIRAIIRDRFLTIFVIILINYLFNLIL